MTPCPLCATPSRVFMDEQLRCETYHCPHCELIFKSNHAHPTKAQELKKYNEHNNTIEHEGYVAMFEQFIGFTLTHATHPVQRILDFGSGPEPVLAALLRRRGFDVRIYDKYFAAQLPHEDEKFDLITSTEVIEHIADPLQTLAWMKAHLVPGGTIALMTQFHDNSETFYQKWWYRRDPTHLSFFTPRTFEVAAQKLTMVCCANDGKKTVLLTS